MAERTVIPVAHDFTCGWCYLGMLQARELRTEFDIEFDWLGYDLYPESIPWSDSPPVPAVESNRPKTPTRFQLAVGAQGITMPRIDRPKRMRIHYALESVEFAKSLGNPEPWIEALYEAYWARGCAIGEIDVLTEIATGFDFDVLKLRDALDSRRYSDRIVQFDAAAHATGVYNLPTFWIGEERFAEQPLTVLRKALMKLNQT